jgi:hypothetical protein
MMKTFGQIAINKEYGYKNYVTVNRNAEDRKKVSFESEEMRDVKPKN